MPQIPYQFYFGNACDLKAKTVAEYSLDLDPDGDLIIVSPDLNDVSPGADIKSEPEVDEKASKKPKLHNESAWVVRASSKHLALASKFFKSVFARMEKSNDSFPIHFPLPDPGHRALGILFQLAHGINSNLPKEVTPLVLARMADYVDYFDLSHVIPNFVSSSWLRSAIKLLPTEKDLFTKPAEIELDDNCSKVLAPWLCIYRVFGTGSGPSKVVALAKRCYREDFTQFGFQVPGSYAESIQQQREMEVSVLITVCGQVLGELSKTIKEPDGCTFDMVQDLYYAKLLRWMTHHKLIVTAGDFKRPESVLILLNDLQHFATYFDTYQAQLQEHAYRNGYLQHEHTWRIISSEVIDYAQTLSQQMHSHTQDELVGILWGLTRVTVKYKGCMSKVPLPSQPLIQAPAAPSTAA